MKKLMALLLVFCLVLSAAACGGSTKNDTTSASQSTTAKEAEGTKDTEAASKDSGMSDAEKQAHYEELFKHPADLKHAGESMTMSGVQDGQMVLTRYDKAGEDQMMSMSVAKAAYAVYNVGGRTYLYVITHTDAGDTENFYVAEKTEEGEEDESGTGDINQPDMGLDDDEDAYEVKYVGAEDGYEVVEMTEKNVENTPTSRIYFNDKDEIVMMVSGDDEGEMTVMFYDVDEITLPDLEAQEVSGDDFSMYMFAALLAIAGYGDGGDGEDGEDDYQLEDNYSIDETVLVDDDNVTITLNSFGVNWGMVEMSLSVENKTDKTVYAFIDENKIDGYTVNEGFFGSTLEPGDVYEDSTYFYSDTLKALGITAIDELTIRFCVYEDNDYDNYITDNTVTIFPTGKAPQDVEYPERRTGENELVAVDNDQMTFIIIEDAEDEFYGYQLKCFLENKTLEPLSFQLTEITVNGEEADCYVYYTLNGGSKTYVDYSLDDLKVDAADIEEVVFTLVAEDDEYEEVFSKDAVYRK